MPHKEKEKKELLYGLVETGLIPYAAGARVEVYRAKHGGHIVLKYPDGDYYFVKVQRSSWTGAS